ncbi:MAG: hypothetical protein O7D91_21395 [Planctomycetota bacterium]|nr:hypothetical protein [Planctomycetota bacterium]
MAELLGEMSLLLDLPERPADLAKRYHNKYAKQAARVMMEKHHAVNVPKHFKRGARQRYGYKPRNPRYVRSKQRRYHTGGLDLVKTSRSKRRMTTQFRLKVGGNAEQRTLTPVLILRWPFKGGTNKFKKHSHQAVTIQQMTKEMERFANDEPAMLAKWFLDEYMRLVDNHRSARQRKRFPVT